MKKLSIITVTYNVSHAIIPTLESVRSVKTPEVEYIIVDGGSKDDTLQIIQNYKDVVDIFISEPDKGIYDAMNKGIELAHGEWIIFQNCGDVMLSIPIEAIKTADASVVAICGCTTDEKGLIQKPKFDTSMYYGNSIPHQGLFYRRSYKPHFDIRYKIFADYDLNLKMFREHVSVKLIDDVVAIHSLDGVSMNKKYVREVYKVLRNRCGFFRMIRLFIHWKWSGIKRRIGILNTYNP